MPLQLAFESMGVGPPVVILHGLFGSGRNWRSVARSLASQQQVLCVDLRNHGASPWADSMDYREMAADVLALIDHQRLRRPTVIGHSMGGKTAMALALQSPESVGRLVVVDIAPVAYNDRLTPYVEAMRSIDAVALASRSEAERRLSEVVTEPGIAGFLLQNLVSRNDHFDWRLNLAAIHAAIPTLSGFPSDLLGHCYDGPTTLIVGTKSDYVAPGDGATMTALFPKVDFQVIEGAGHWVHVDRPTEFMAAVRMTPAPVA